MAASHDEINVFKIPHSRMMQLVNACNNKLTVTDFANSDALFGLLTNLQGVFKEFKSHEEIENEFIMKKLKSKLKALAIHNSAVCNCHNDDEFTPLLNLVDMGYLHINKTKTTSEKISFGIKLRKALNHFTKRFVPHMKEEEEVFQPLLMEYFTEEELVEMKIIVIKSHMQQRKSPSGAKLNDTDLNQSTVAHLNDLPDELLLNIFSYLSKSDVLKAAQVNRKWNGLVYDKTNWRNLDFDEWIQKKNCFLDFDAEQEDNQRTFGFKDMDYIDESDEEYEDESQIKQSEVKLLQFWIRDFLPKVGSYLEELTITKCKSLNNNLARRILQLCPNLRALNLSYTPISDNSFRSVKLNKLEQLNCEGCENLSDKAFKYLLLSTKTRQTESDCITNQHKCSLKNESLCNSCSKYQSNSIEEISNKHRGHFSSSQADDNTRLKYINLSGCWSLTDSGLEYIATVYDLKELQYLNLSGCLNVSSIGMNLFVRVSEQLHGENLYYCDNIDNGPLRETANGCENLECGSKFCCRNAL